MKIQNFDDKDLAMAGIVLLCIVGGIMLAIAGRDVIGDARFAVFTAIGAIFSGGIAAIAALATGRKKKEGE